MTHACKNCSNLFEGKYCNECGEKVYHDDRSFKHIFEEFFHFLTHFEGTFFNTMKVVVVSPGKLSLDYISGIRKKYFKPVPFFLMVVILYLLFPLYEGLNMKLRYHKMSLYGSYAREVAAKVQEKRGYTDEQIEEVFHRKGEKTSKFLLFVIIPFAALLSFGMAFKKRKFYYDHFIFSTEIAAFYILWGYLLMPWIGKFLYFIGVPFTELWIAIATSVGLIAYVGLAAFRCFRLSIGYTFLYTVIFTVGFLAIAQYLYRFILFVVTINLI